MTQPIFTGLKLLVVDDDQDSLELMDVFLSGEGAEVVTADCVETALSALRREKLDCLISDIRMPGGTGYDLLGVIRRPDFTKNNCIPAIAVTSHARPEDRNACLAAGFQVYFAKPVDLMELRSAIAQVAQRINPVT